MAKTEDGYIQLGSENTSYISVGKAVKNLLEEKSKELGVRKGIIYRAFGTWAGSNLTVEAWQQMLKEAKKAGLKEVSPLELFFTNGVDAQLKVGWVKAAIMAMVEAGTVTGKAFQKATDLLNRIAEGQPVSSSEFEAYRPPEKKEAKAETETEADEEPSEEPTEEPEEEPVEEEEPSDEVPDYMNMEFKAIKKLVKDLDLKVKGKRKRDFQKALKEHYGQ
jgi:hypothetical protein